MKIVVDTSAIIAVITNEKHKKKLIAAAKGADLIAPRSLHWEIGNAFSAMMKRRRIEFSEALDAVEAYGRIPIRWIDVSIPRALEFCASQGIYAYDAFFLECAQSQKAPLLSLDGGLLEAAREARISVIEVQP
jgi:predicted nucleic acid-binding protein